MPTTVNGVGTHYYGKRNHSTRTAACRFCHRVGNLESYDTRLWFVIMFIPVIPLRRKRITDYCASCRRHYAANADAYEQAKQLQISEGMERFRREPSAAAASTLHAQLLAFRQFGQAAQFRSGVLPQFADDAALRVEMAEQLRELAAEREAAPLFQEALGMDAEHPGARAGAALTRMQEGSLDEAQRLLEFLEEPGAGQHYPLGPLEILARQDQRAGRHDEALRLAAVLLREVPNVGNAYAFRSFVRKSEKALGRTESILPEKPFSLLGLFRSKGSPYAPWQRAVAMIGTALALLAIALAINNEYIRRHRTIYVVNACGSPAQVQVDDQPPVAVSGLGRVSVAEGQHTIKVAGPVDETHAITVQSGYFARWFRTPAWVLNPGGEAVLEVMTHVYSSSKSAKAGSKRLVVAEPFYHLADCDYLFEDPPSSISVSEGSRDVIKWELNWLQGHDLDVFYEVADSDHDCAMSFAERRLQRDPEQTELLKACLAQATEEDRTPIALFLKTGLDRRPVLISWHRAYQGLGERVVTESELVTRYDRYLAAEPRNAALLYLRGRIEPDSDKALPYLRRAIDADPRLPWPWLALAARAAAQARWDECLAATRKAKELHFEDPDSVNYVHVARLAKGEAAAVADEYRHRMSAGKLAPAELFPFVDALAAAGQSAEIDSTVAAFVDQLPVQVRPQVAPFFHAYALYQQGKNKECATLCGGNAVLAHAPIRAQALLAMGDARTAAHDPYLEKVWNDPWQALALSVALVLEHQADDAVKWHNKAVEKLEMEEPASKRAGSLLAAKAPPSADVLMRLYLLPPQKALLLVALATRFPQKQAECRALAVKLNVQRSPPYQFVRRVLDQRVASKP